MQSVIWYSLFIQAWGILNITPLLHSVCPSKRTGIPLENLLSQILEAYTINGSLHSIKQLPPTYRFIIPSCGTKASNSVLYAVFRNQEIDYDYLLMQAALNYTKAYFNHESAWYFTISEHIIERPKSSKSEGISIVYDHDRQKHLSGLKYVLLSLTDGCLTVPLSFRIAVSKHQNLNQKFNTALSSSFGEQIRKDALFSQEEIVIQLIQQARSKIYSQFHKPIDGVIADHSLNLDSQLVLNFSRHNRLPMMFPVHTSQQRFAIINSLYFPQQEVFTLYYCTKHLKQHYQKQLEQAYFTASAQVQRISGSKQKYQLLFTIQPNFIHSYFDSLYENNELCLEWLEMANQKHTLLHDSSHLKAMSSPKLQDCSLERSCMQYSCALIDSAVRNSRHSHASCVQTVEDRCHNKPFAPHAEQSRDTHALLGLFDSKWKEEWTEDRVTEISVDWSMDWTTELSVEWSKKIATVLNVEWTQDQDAALSEDWHKGYLSLHERFIPLELDAKKHTYEPIKKWSELYLVTSSKVLDHNVNHVSDIVTTCAVLRHDVDLIHDVDISYDISVYDIVSSSNATSSIQHKMNRVAKSESALSSDSIQTKDLIKPVSHNQSSFAQEALASTTNYKYRPTKDTRVLAIRETSQSTELETFQNDCYACPNTNYVHQKDSNLYQSINMSPVAVKHSVYKGKSYLYPSPKLMILCHNFQKESPENLVHLFHIYKGTAKLSNFLKEQFVKDSCYFANVFDAAFATFSLANLMYIIRSSIKQQKNTELKAPQEE